MGRDYTTPSSVILRCQHFGNNRLKMLIYDGDAALFRLFLPRVGCRAYVFRRFHSKIVRPRLCSALPPDYLPVTLPINHPLIAGSRINR